MTHDELTEYLHDEFGVPYPTAVDMASRMMERLRVIPHDQVMLETVLSGPLTGGGHQHNVALTHGTGTCPWGAAAVEDPW